MGFLWPRYQELEDDVEVGFLWPQYQELEDDVVVGFLWSRCQELEDDVVVGFLNQRYSCSFLSATLTYKRYLSARDPIPEFQSFYIFPTI